MPKRKTIHVVIGSPGLLREVPRLHADRDLTVSSEIRQTVGWTDDCMLWRYIRKLGALEGGMAQFFGWGTG